jgi:uroporphyrinogen-III decarboxylase
LDLAVKLRGHEQVVLDMIDEPDKCHELLDRLANIFVTVSKNVLAHIHPYHGGYYDAVFDLWAPGTLVRLQEDAMAVLSPQLYSDFIQPLDAMTAGEFDYSIMHLHTNSRFILDRILDIDNLTSIQLNHEPFSVQLKEMLPYYQLIQKHNKPLVLRGNFTEQEAHMLIGELEPEGLLILNVVDDFPKLDKLKAAYGMA